MKFQLDSEFVEEQPFSESKRKMTEEGSAKRRKSSRHSEQQRQQEAKVESIDAITVEQAPVAHDFNPFEQQNALDNIIDHQRRRSIKTETVESSLVSTVPLSEFSSSSIKKGKKRRHEETELDERMDERAQKRPTEERSDVHEDGDREEVDRKEKRSEQIAIWNKRTDIIDNEVVETRRIKTKTRKFTRGADKHYAMPFEEAVELVKANPICGVKIVREQRHVSLPMHHIGETYTQAVDYILQNSVGKFRKQTLGVVLSIGEVKRISHGRLIDEQMAYHTDVLVTMAIFRPSQSQEYEAVVTHVGHDFFTALILNIIPIKVPYTAQIKRTLKKQEIEINDKVLVTYRQSTINRAMCLLQGDFVQLKEKGIPPTEEEIEDAEYNFGQLEQQMQEGYDVEQTDEGTGLERETTGIEMQRGRDNRVSRADQFDAPVAKRVRFESSDEEGEITGEISRTDDDTDTEKAKRARKEKKKVAAIASDRVRRNASKTPFEI